MLPGGEIMIKHKDAFLLKTEASCLGSKRHKLGDFVMASSGSDKSSSIPLSGCYSQIILKARGGEVQCNFLNYPDTKGTYWYVSVVSG